MRDIPLQRRDKQQYSFPDILNNASVGKAFDSLFQTNIHESERAVDTALIYVFFSFEYRVLCPLDFFMINIRNEIEPQQPSVARN